MLSLQRMEFKKENHFLLKIQYSYLKVRLYNVYTLEIIFIPYIWNILSGIVFLHNEVLNIVFFKSPFDLAKVQRLLSSSKVDEDKFPCIIRYF